MNALKWKKNLLLCLGILIFSSSLQANKNTLPLSLSQTPSIQELVDDMTEQGNYFYHRLQHTLDEIHKETQTQQTEVIDNSVFSIFRGRMANLESEYQSDYAQILQDLIGSGLATQITEFEEKGRKISSRFKQIKQAIQKVEQSSIGQRKFKIQSLATLLRSFKYIAVDLPVDKTLTTFTQSIDEKLITTSEANFTKRGKTNQPIYISQWDEQTNHHLIGLVKWLVTALINESKAAPKELPTEASSCSYVASDLAADGVDIILSQEIKDLAQQLQYSPARIFNYVSQKITFEPYYGALKGAVGTLHSQSGGATDQASLLIALLRASNIPSRYVKGKVVYTDKTALGQDGKAPRWLSTKTYKAAARRLARGQNPAGARVVTNDSGDIIGNTFNQVWVEACIPYSNYRGIHAGGNGYQWIPLDPSIEDHQYQAGIQINVKFDYASYLSNRTNKLPHEFYQEGISKKLANGQALSDIPFQGKKAQINYDILPTTLPYFVDQYLNWSNSSNSETAVLPDSHRYHLKVSVKKPSGDVLLPEKDLLFSQVLLKRLTLSFKGATPSNQTALNNWRLDENLNTILPCSINIIASLKLEGVELASGTESTGICTSRNQLSYKITLDEGLNNHPPSEASSAATNIINEVNFTNIDATNLHALQTYAFHISDRLLAERSEQLLQAIKDNRNPNSNVDETEGEYLHIVGLQYMRHLSDSTKTIALLSNGTGDSGYHMGLTSTKMKVEYLFDIPFAVHRGGMLVDIPGGQTRNIDLTTGLIDWDSFLLSGYSASAYESYIWQENAALDAVSSVRGLQFANEQGIEELQLTSSNWESEQSKFTSNTDSSLNYSTAQINSIKSNYIDKGYTVKVPRSQILYDSWKGVVFVAECNNCQGDGAVKAGYIISGGYAGGYTLPRNASSPPVIYNPDINIGYVPVSYIPPVVNEHIVNTGIPYNSTTASKGFNVNQVFSGDPVNLVTGNFYYNEQDLIIPGRGGLSFVFERTYNSQDPEDSPLGYGWTHSFNHFLKFYGHDTADNRVKVSWVDGSGGEKFFSLPGATVPTNSPDFENDVGVHVVLKRESNGQYSITQKNGLTYTFASNAGATNDQKAKLLFIKDKNNNQLTLNYNNSNQDKLLSVSDDLNRSLTLAYANGGSSHYIESLTDFSGRQWHYNINTAGDLIEVKPPLVVEGTMAPLIYNYYTAADGHNKAHLLKRKQSAEGKGMTFEYYANGQVFRHTDDLGGSIRFNYNNFRRETVVTDERGYATHHFFDEYGNPVKIVDADGATETFEYDPAEPLNRLAHTNKGGLKTQYEYNSNGDLIKITQPSGDTIQYGFYNTYHQAQKVQDARGNINLMQYDSQGNLTDSIKLKAGIDRDPETNKTPYTPIETDVLSWTRFEYDRYGNNIQIQQIKSLIEESGTLPLGPIVRKTYDSNALYLINISRCGAADLNEDNTTDKQECQTATVIYDTLGRKTQGIDASWYPTKTHYDSNNRSTQSSDNQGQLHSYTYNQDNQLLQRQLLIGNTQHDSEQYRYDQAGRLSQSIDAGGETSQYQYDRSGNLIKITDPDNYTLTLDYDQRGHWTSAEDKGQHQVTRKLDALGRIQSITDPNGNTQRYEYYGASDNGRLYRKYDALNRVSEYHYTPTGQVSKYIDHEGHSTTTEYDAAGRAIRIVQPGYLDNNLDSVTYNQTIYPVTLYHYNLLGQQTDIYAGYTTDPAERKQDQTSLQKQQDYDDFNRLTQSTDALNRSHTYQYNNHNQLSQSKDGNNDITSYQWQQGNLLKQKNNSAGTNSYDYNALGKITQAQDKHSINNYEYDASHRLKSSYDARQSWTAETGQATAKSLHYKYSPGGLLDRLTDNQGQETDYRYDPTGRLTTLWDSNWDSTQFTYDAGGRLTQQSNPNHISQSYSYRADDSLKSHLVKNTGSGNPILEQHYQIDPLGRIKQKIETLNNTTETTDYLYDPLGRLTQADNQSPATKQNWRYDAFGNRTQQTTGISTGTESTEISIHDATNQLIEIRSTTSTGTLKQAFIYDGNGNQIKDCQGTSVTRNTTTNDCTGSTEIELIYNADQELIQVNKTGIPTEHYQYDSQGRRIEKIIGENSPNNPNKTRYHYNGDNIYAQYTTRDSTNPHYRYVQLGLDQPLSRYNETEQTTYYLQGAHNNILGTTDQQGSLTSYQQYDSWGNTKNQSTTKTPQYGYQGREPNNTGLIYYRTRYYQPQTGRFTQQDPKGFIDGINKYAYAVNSPINYSDPYGTSVNSSAYTPSYTEDQNYFSSGSSFENIVDNVIDYGIDIASVGLTAFDIMNTPISPTADTVFIAAALQSGKQGIKNTVKTGINWTKNQITKVRSKAYLKDVGSYTNTHLSGKTYSGKGSRFRSQKSAKRWAKDENDPHVATDFTRARNTRDAFKQESRRIDANGGVKSSSNYNKIESPGRKYRLQDGDL